MKPIHSLLLSVIIIIAFACHQPAGDTAGKPAADPLDPASRDTSVRAQDNFFLYANGNFLKTTIIPASMANYGTFTIMQDSNLNRMHRILDSLAAIPNAVKGSIAQQTGDLFASGMDSAGIEKNGLAPAKPELDRINAIGDLAAAVSEAGRELQENHHPFLHITVTADDKNSAMNILHVDQGGLGMPSRDYYFKADSSIKKIRDGYLQHIARMFVLTGIDAGAAEKKAAAVLAFETSLAAISSTPVQLRDPETNYHKLTAAAISAGSPLFSTLLQGMQIKPDTLLAGQPAFLKGLFVELSKTPLPVIKDYLSFHVLDDDAPYLSSAFVAENFAFAKMMTGQKELRPRWKRMTSMVDQELGDGLGQIFVNIYFPPAAKQRIGEMVDNILATYGERLQRLDWMSDSTRQKAIVKLKAIVKKVGYPDKWKDYSTLTINRNDILGNIRQTTHYEYLRSVAKIGKPVDRSEWEMTPPTINAYYEPTANNINFPAGILSAPFFSLDADDAVNYGAIGFVIGHEITHGFDDQGRQYDAEGNLHQWWSKEDVSRFKKRAEFIIRQYNGYLVVDTLHLNGELTEGENIADNGGLAIAYDAFKKTPQGKSTAMIGGLTPDQRFFLSAAQVWKRKDTRENLRTVAMTNPHSTAMYRVNGPVSNIPAFYQAFNVQPTDSMYRADSLRVKIW